MYYKNDINHPDIFFVEFISQIVEIDQYYYFDI